MSADLAVVIVNYETGAYLRRCLASLERHRGPIEVEALVIDNASRDGSHRAAVKAHPWVRLIENPTNVYLSPAWNQGARETTAPWLLFLNPDTEWFAGTLAGFVEAARRHDRVGIVGPMIRNPDGTVYPSGRTFPGVFDALGHALWSPLSRRNPFTRRYELADWDRRSEREVDWVSGACMLIPREAFEEAGGFDEGFRLYGEELDLATRMRELGRRVLFTPSAEVIHEGGVSTGRTRRFLLMHSQSIYRYYRKHRARGIRRATLPLAWAVLRARAELAWAVERARGWWA
ncbi:MAG: N-acetylglucosaminyl-diphospho-decaprenol L-rhamnosyltransferase [Actinomycetota bacterium]|jgi:N-acetylglucosaminyl-diphospho-decaprenol L-rhamnosyltransferase|nr:MAG: N-acetylglucosaminyl-diphospho-decaprenol L-rhamnosyltransferase [Actinomycetota bacterium]